MSCFDPDESTRFFKIVRQVRGRMALVCGELSLHAQLVKPVHGYAGVGAKQERFSRIGTGEPASSSKTDSRK